MRGLLAFLTAVTCSSPLLAQPGDDLADLHRPEPDLEPVEEVDLPEWRHKDSMEVNSLGIFAVGMWGHMDRYGLEISPGFEEPGPLVGKELKLNGSAALAGAGFRGAFQSKRWGIRFALGFNGMYGDGFELEHDELPEGVSAELGHVALTNFEFSLGKGFDATHFYPYIDIKMGINVVLAQIDVATNAFGHMGSSTYVVPSLSFGPRAGLFVPLDGDWFIDVSGQYAFIGIERAAGFVGFGTWDD